MTDDAQDGAPTSACRLLTHTASHSPRPHAGDAEQVIVDTEDFRTGRIGRCTYDGSWSEAVRRALVTLKALSYSPPAASWPPPRRCPSRPCLAARLLGGASTRTSAGRDEQDL
ncbi:hypothetical protein ACRAKI_16135 [Saccharothrix isguenensis]